MGRDCWRVSLVIRGRDWLETRDRGRERGRGVAWMIAETSGLTGRSLGKEIECSEARLDLRGILSGRDLGEEGGQGNEERGSSPS